jgi:hypothetical protein
MLTAKWLFAVSRLSRHGQHRCRRSGGRLMSAICVSSDLSVTIEDVADDLMLFAPLPSDGRSFSTRIGVGEMVLPVDDATVERFLAKCAPLDDQGHRWWLGAIDGGADRSGGYGRFQAGSGDTLVTTTAHRYAWTLEHGPIPQGLVVRHRCDEPLCTATNDLVLGTYADNR